MDCLRQDISSFEPITLEELSLDTVLHRMDTKFLLHPHQLVDLITLLKNNFKVLDMDGVRLMSYETNYFDTPDLRLFLEHHNGYDRRVKIRIRSYLDSGLHFFELKKKQTGNFTIKERISLRYYSDELPADCKALIHYPRLNLQPLQHTLKNTFRRLTFVSKEGNERITADGNIFFESESGQLLLKDIIVLELKQDRLNRQSSAYQALKKLRLQPDSFSKYAMGVVLTKLHSKYNNFKPSLLKVLKLSPEIKENLHA
jgi:hypothetical protein